MKSLTILFILTFFFAPSFADYRNDGPDEVYFSNGINCDPVTGKRYRAIFKVSTLQVLFSEAPVSIEIFGKKNTSHQIQAGILFPLENDSFLRQMFQSGGINATASDKGLLSYRNSPYNSHGISFKYELRKYGQNFYYAPQLMFKYSYYDDEIFSIFSEGRVIGIKESKFSRVYGIGFMAGRQTYFMRQATDWYAGIGIRARSMSVKMAGSGNNVQEAGTEYPAGEKFFSIYPFINFGFRTGLVF